MKTSHLSALMVLLLGAASGRADTLVQWGEIPSGAGTPGTNIVQANQNLIGSGSTYSGNTNNPAVGANYYPDATGRSPYFSAAINSITNGGARIVENAGSGDRITMYILAPTGGTCRGMVTWSSNYFQAVTTPFVLTSVTVVVNQRLNVFSTNQALRLLVKQGDSFYASAPQSFGANAVTNLFVPQTETWHTFTPFTGGVETVGAATDAPSFTNIQAVGYYFSVQNDAAIASNVGAQVSGFIAQGGMAGAGPATYTLSASVNDSTWGSVDPSGGTYEAGTNITLTATASNYYQFIGWSGDLGGTTNPVTITMDADKSITAHFAELLATNNTPIWWLALHSLTTDDAGAISDTDGDGVPAWQEYVAGTDPTTPASVFRMTSLKTPSGAGVLQWSSVSGRVYEVSWSTNALGGFTAFGDATNLAWDANSYTDHLHNAETLLLYRVGVRRNP